VNQLDISPPSKVIDICCGSCNLLHAAKKRWPEAKLIGVDVICNNISDVHCIQCDGRKYSIEHSEQYLLVLANPPFDFVARKNEYPELYSNIPTGYITSRLEIEMLLANLRLLSDNGTLMIIMPSTFVNAESNIKIRKYLADRYQIEKIIRLPEEAFGSAKINSYALIITRNKLRKELTKLFSVTLKEDKCSISELAVIPNKEVKAGKWDEVTTTKNDLTSKLKMKRGNISSQSFTFAGIPIFHTAKSGNPWKPSIRYVSNITKTPVYAENGDIIVSRVGKSAGCWYKHTGDKIMISDCLYCIKDPDGIVAKKLEGQVYSYSLKGVATRYITMADFSAWYESLDV